MPLPRSHLLSISLLMLSACSALDDDVREDPPPGASPASTATTSSSLLFTPPNPHGHLSLVTDFEGAFAHTLGETNWHDVPGMSAVAWTQAGDNLEVDFSGSIGGEDADDGVWVRILIDGVPAAPSDVLFKHGETAALRSFRFVATGLTFGAHIVQAQWLGDEDARITNHALSVHAAPPAGASSLLVFSPPSGPPVVNTSGAWTKVQGAAGTLTAAAAGPLVITFSAESQGEAGALRVRAVVNGTPLAPVVMHGDGLHGRYAARTIQFVTQVAAGRNNVAMEWATTSGGEVKLGDRSLTLFTGAPAGSGGSHAASQTNGEVAIGSEWTKIGSVSYTNADAGAISAVRASLEARGGTDAIWIRALQDERVPVGPPEVLALVFDDSFGAYTHTFHLKDQEPGPHEITLWAKSLSILSGAQVRHRSLSVVTNRRHGADFAQPLDGMGPRRGSLPHLVLCMDAKRSLPDGSGTARKLTDLELQQIFAGGDGRKSVAGWLAEQSLGAFTLGPQTITSCTTTPRPQDWYWQGDHGRFLTMHEDALANADPFVNFLQFDANGDRALTPDEVLVTIVKPQQGNFGQAGNSVTLELDGEELTVHYADVYLEPPGLRPPFDPRAPNVGVAAHEMAHLVLRATDLAGGDLFSTMSNTGWAGHLDPIHKLLSGWVVPDAIEISSLATAQVGLRAVEVGGEGVLVYDRTRPAEVLLIENRWMSPTNYDGQDVPGHFGVGGVVVWHAAFDLVHRRWDPPSAHIRVQRALVQPSPADPLIASWGDGTPAISIDTTSTSPSQTMNLSITKLP